MKALRILPGKGFEALDRSRRVKNHFISRSCLLVRSQ